MPLVRRHNAVLALGPVLIEAGCIGTAYLLSAWTAFPEDPLRRSAAGHLAWLVLLLAAWYLQAVDQRLYLSRRSDALVPQLTDVARAAFTAVLLSIFMAALFSPAGIERVFAGLFGVFSIAFLLLFRLAARLSLWGLRGRGYNYRQVVIVGANERTRALLRVILSHEQYGFHVAGILEDDPEREDGLQGYGVPYLGPIRELERHLTEQVVDVVYVTLPLRSQYETVQDIAYLCEGVGVPVRLVGDLFLAGTSRCEVFRLEDIPLLTLSRRNLDARFDLQKISEWLAATVLLLFLSPILLVTALLVKLGSAGPVFVREWPAGTRGRLRFRTRALRPAHEPPDSSGDLEIAPPITPIGAALRRYSLHELPEAIDAWIPWGTRKSGPQTACEGSTEAGPREPGPPQPAAGLSRIPKIRIMMAFLDSLAILLAFLAAAYDSLPWNSTYQAHLGRHAPYLLLFLILWYVAAIDQRIFRVWRPGNLADYLFAVTKAVGSALVYGTVIVALLSQTPIDRRFLLTFCLCTPLALMAARVLFRTAIALLQRRGLFQRRVLLAGANERTRQLAETLIRSRRHAYAISGILDDEPERCPPFAAMGIPHLGGPAQLEECIEKGPVREVFVGLPLRSFYEIIQEMVLACERHGISLAVPADLFRLKVASNRLMYVDDLPVISLSAVPETQFWLAIKRLVDLAVSTMLLLPMIPVFLAVGILIKLDSKGPVFFLQERIGQNQRRFKMIKFRTMVANAEALKKELEALNEADGPVFKIRKDPRLTRIGGFMRKHSLDEFPQLINVWLGQMSLVGPRPPVYSEVVRYTWAQRRRLSVRPGMTGLWQVSGRSDVGFEEWVGLDLQYIDTWTLSQDFTILFKTFKEVFYGRGAA